MGLGGQCCTPAALPPGKTWYPLYRRLGGPQGRSGQVQKISPPPGFDPRTVQPVVSHCTNCTIIISDIRKWNKSYCVWYSVFETFSNMLSVYWLFQSLFSIFYENVPKRIVFWIHYFVLVESFFGDIWCHFKHCLCLLAKRWVLIFKLLGGR